MALFTGFGKQHFISAGLRIGDAKDNSNPETERPGDELNLVTYLRKTPKLRSVETFGVKRSALIGILSQLGR